MALIKCSECGKEISDKASACLGCGCPIEEATVLSLPETVKCLDCKKSLPETVECLDCKKSFPFNVHTCPHCGLFNSQKYALLEALKLAEPIQANVYKAPVDNNKPAVSVYDYDSSSSRTNLADNNALEVPVNNHTSISSGFGILLNAIFILYNIVAIYFWFHYWNQSFPYVSFSSILAFPFYSIKGALWPIFIFF